MEEPIPMIPLKQWVHETALAEGVGPYAVWNRIYRGQYPGLALLRVNSYWVYVLNPYDVLLSPQRRLSFRRWVEIEARREGVTTRCIYCRYYRGKYPWLRLRRPGKRHLFVLNPCEVQSGPVRRISLWNWVKLEAHREGRTPSAIYMRYHRGKYPGLKLHRPGKRAYVLNPAENIRVDMGPRRSKRDA